jgi:predicted CopG family antitoxin
MTKVISLSDVAYAEMKALKQKDESFSDVVMRLAESTRKRPLSDFFGKWPGAAEEAERIKGAIAADRKRFRTREVKF